MKLCTSTTHIIQLTKTEHLMQQTFLYNHRYFCPYFFLHRVFLTGVKQALIFYCIAKNTVLLASYYDNYVNEDEARGVLLNEH